MEWENKIFEGIHYSRFIVSYAKVGGELNKRWLFEDWLRTLVINGKVIPEEVIDEIGFIASNGKLELQTSAREFLRNEKEWES